MQVILGFEFLCEMPLALVSSVVATSAKHIPDRIDLRAHALDPREVGVVEHSGVLDMLTGIDNRPG